MLRFLPHPLARKLVKDESFAELRETIRVQGQLLPALCIKGEHNGDLLVFDGIRRKGVQDELGKPLQHVVCPYTLQQLPEIIAALNCQRWDLTAAQRAAYCVEYVLPAMMAEAKERQKLSDGRPEAAEKGSANLRYLKKDGDAGESEKGSANLRYLKNFGKACERAALMCRCKPRNVEHLWRIKQTRPKLVTEVASGKINAHQAVTRFKNQLDEDMLRREGEIAARIPVTERWEIRIGDNADVLPTLARRRFPLIVVDPQYNIGIDYGNGSKHDKLTKEEYLARAKGWIGETAEVSTPTGTLWIIINDEWAAHLKLMAEDFGWHLRSWVKWYETYGANCTEKFNRTSRHLFYFVRDPKRFTFHHKPFHRTTARREIYNDKRQAAPKKLFDDVWIISRVVSSAERVPGVPTQIPLALMSPIVEGCSNPGDEVADFFSGSATTGVAAVSSGRKYFGIEIHPPYAELSMARLNRAIGLEAARA